MLIDRVNNEEELREKEGQWVYRITTLAPDRLNANDFFYSQNRRARAPLICLDLFAFYFVFYSTQFKNARPKPFGITRAHRLLLYASGVCISTHVCNG